VEALQLLQLAVRMARLAQVYASLTSVNRNSCGIEYLHFRVGLVISFVFFQRPAQTLILFTVQYRQFSWVASAITHKEVVT